MPQADDEQKLLEEQPIQSGRGRPGRPEASQSPERKSVASGNSASSSALAAYLGIAEHKNELLWVLAAISVLTIAGRIVSIKASSQFSAEDAEVFHKPIFLCIVVTGSLTFLLPFTDWKPENYESSVHMRMLANSFAGFVGVTFTAISLIFLPASVATIGRIGGMLVMTAIWARVSNRQMLDYEHWGWIFVVSAGVICAGRGQVQVEANYKTLVGLMALLIADVADTAEIFLAQGVLQDVGLSEFVFTGWKGLCSASMALLAALIAQMLPGFDNGYLEDTISTVTVLFKYPSILLITIVIAFFSLASMLTGYALTKIYGSLAKGIVRCLTVPTTWGVAVLVHYLAPGSQYGENFTWEEGHLKIVGGVVVFMGSIGYFWHDFRQKELQKA